MSLNRARWRKWLKRKEVRRSEKNVSLAKFGLAYICSRSRIFRAKAGRVFKAAYDENNGDLHDSLCRCGYCDDMNLGHLHIGQDIISRRKIRTQWNAPLHQ